MSEILNLSEPLFIAVLLFIFWETIFHFNYAKINWSPLARLGTFLGCFVVCDILLHILPFLQLLTFFHVWQVKAQQRATQDQIAYFGQTPSQLLKVPHLKKMPVTEVLHLQVIIDWISLTQISKYASLACFLFSCFLHNQALAFWKFFICLTFVALETTILFENIQFPKSRKLMIYLRWMKKGCTLTLNVFVCMKYNVSKLNVFGCITLFEDNFFWQYNGI